MKLARRALVEPARRASSSSQLHRVNGVLVVKRPLRSELWLSSLSRLNNVSGLLVHMLCRL